MKKCTECNKSFTPKRITQITCCRECYEIRHEKLIKNWRERNRETYNKKQLIKYHENFIKQTIAKEMHE